MQVSPNSIIKDQMKIKMPKTPKKFCLETVFVTSAILVALLPFNSASAFNPSLDLSIAENSSPQAVAYREKDLTVMGFYLNAQGENINLSGIKVSITRDGSTAVNSMGISSVNLFKDSAQVGLSATLAQGEAVFTFSTPISITLGSRALFEVKVDMGADKTLYQFKARTLEVTAFGAESTTTNATMSGTAETPFIQAIVPNISITGVKVESPEYLVLGGSDQITFSVDIKNMSNASVDLKNLILGFYGDNSRSLLWKPVISQQSNILAPSATYKLSNVKTGTTSLSNVLGEHPLFFVFDPDNQFEETSKSDNEYTASIRTLKYAPSPPAVISQIQASTTPETAEISWATDILTTGILKYGLESLSLEQSSTQTATSHAVTLRNLKSDSAYTYQIIAEDLKEQKTFSATSTFITLTLTMISNVAGQATTSTTTLITRQEIPKYPPAPKVKTPQNPKFQKTALVKYKKQTYFLHNGKLHFMPKGRRWLKVNCLTGLKTISITLKEFRSLKFGIAKGYSKTDYDKDGLSEKKEKLFGTSPTTADTDKDGFLDGEEVCKGFNPNGPGKL